MNVPTKSVYIGAQGHAMHLNQETLWMKFCEEQGIDIFTAIIPTLLNYAFSAKDGMVAIRKESDWTLK
jgi:hypothetical protein